MGTLHSLLLHCQAPPLVFGLTILDKATAVALFTMSLSLPMRPLPAHVHSRRVLLPIDRDLLLILAGSQSR